MPREKRRKRAQKENFQKRFRNDSNGQLTSPPRDQSEETQMTEEAIAYAAVQDAYNAMQMMEEDVMTEGPSEEEMMMSGDLRNADGEEETVDSYFSRCHDIGTDRWEEQDEREA